MKNGFINRWSLVATLLLAILGSICTATASTLNVGPEGYPTIAGALGDAQDGDTINIIAATQTECGIIISSSVTIQGQGVNNTIVQGAATRSNASDRIFTVNNTACTVTFKDMTIQYGFYSGTDSSGGAAIYNFAGAVIVTNCTIQMNDSQYTGASSPQGGGAISHYRDANTHAFTIVNSSVISNSASSTSAFYNYSGGGISCCGLPNRPNQSLWIDGCTFAWNSASGGGGAIYAVYPSSLTIRNSTLFANFVTTSKTKGGGLSFTTLAGTGGTIYNCTICSNSAVAGGEGITSGSSSLAIYSTILWANGVSDYDTLNSNLILSNCLIGATTGNGTPTTYNCMTGTDPLLQPLADNGGQRQLLFPLTTTTLTHCCECV